MHETLPLQMRVSVTPRTPTPQMTPNGTFPRDARSTAFGDSGHRRASAFDTKGTRLATYCFVRRENQTFVKFASRPGAAIVAEAEKRLANEYARTSIRRLGDRQWIGERSS